MITILKYVRLSYVERVSLRPEFYVFDYIRGKGRQLVQAKKSTCTLILT